MAENNLDPVHFQYVHGMSGTPDMGDLSKAKMERPSLDDLDAEEDSDEEELPELE